MMANTGNRISRKIRIAAIALSVAAAFGAASAPPALADGHGGWHRGGGGWGGWHGGWTGRHHNWEGDSRGYGWGGGYYAPGYYGYGYPPSYAYAPPPVVYPPPYSYGSWWGDDDD